MLSSVLAGSGARRFIVESVERDQKIPELDGILFRVEVPCPPGSVLIVQDGMPDFLSPKKTRRALMLSMPDVRDWLDEG